MGLFKHPLLLLSPPTPHSLVLWLIFIQPHATTDVNHMHQAAIRDKVGYQCSKLKPRRGVFILLSSTITPFSTPFMECEATCSVKNMRNPNHRCMTCMHLCRLRHHQFLIFHPILPQHLSSVKLPSTPQQHTPFILLSENKCNPLSSGFLYKIKGSYLLQSHMPDANTMQAE